MLLWWPLHVANSWAESAKLSFIAGTAACRTLFLCGRDSHTGQDYSPCRDWIVNREERLAGLFAAGEYLAADPLDEPVTCCNAACALTGESTVEEFFSEYKGLEGENNGELDGSRFNHNRE